MEMLQVIGAIFSIVGTIAIPSVFGLLYHMNRQQVGFYKGFLMDNLIEQLRKQIKIADNVISDMGKKHQEELAKRDTNAAKEISQLKEKVEALRYELQITGDYLFGRDYRTEIMKKEGRQ